MLSIIAKLLAALNANSRPGEIAAGAAFGLLLALIPSGNLLWIGLFIIVFLLRVHLASALLIMALGKLVVPLADSLIESAGLLVLRQDALLPFFTSLANRPIIPYTAFNNSLVMGGLVIGILLWVPVFFIFILLVSLYRNILWPRLAENKMVKAFQRFPLVSKISRAAGKAGSIYRGGV